MAYSNTLHLGYDTFTAYFTTELNAIVNNANSAAGAAIDNSTNLRLYMDLRLSLGIQTARSAGAVVIAFIVPSVDGSTYDDVLDTICKPVASFPFDAAVTARVCSEINIPIPPGLFKLFLRNSTGQTFAATGNTLGYRTHSIKTGS